MRLEELLNQYSDRLSENDLHMGLCGETQKQCENMTIERTCKEM